MNLSWVSENGLRFHIETSQSAAQNGSRWRALCGAQGVCNFNRGAKAIVLSMRCATCQDLSTTGISDVASKATGSAPATDSHHAGDEGGEVLSAQADRETSRGDVRHAPPDNWQAKLYSGEMLNGFERAVMDAELRAGITRSSDSEIGDEYDRAMAQGF